VGARDRARVLRVTLISVAILLVLAPALPARAGVALVRGRAPHAETRFDTVELVLVDQSRGTPSTPTEAGAPTRTVPTTVRVPVTRPVRARPLIVLAHGLNGQPSMLDELADAWAKAGFVVATPRLPRTNVDDGGKAVLADASEYPGDLSFVITRLLALSRSSISGPLQGRIDAAHIGAAGVSLGGMAVYGLVSNTCCRDRRVDAAVLMAAVRPPIPHGRYVPTTVPVLLVHGDADTGYHHSVDAYPTLGTPKWFITLHGGLHGPPFEDPPDDFDPLVRATTTAFWQLSLDGDRRAATRIVDLVERDPSGASIRRSLGG
jgi:alpha-beta hydrolase superfamily lysophospholipase